MFSWAIEQGYIRETPFKIGAHNVVKLTPEEPRRRRLNPGEEDRLLAVIGPHLRALLIALLSTGCRIGELLSLQWKDVQHTDGPKGEPVPCNLLLPAAKTKTNKTREVPVGSSLAAVLAMRRHGPDGKPLPPSAYVFGNEVGERVKSVRTAWTATCRRAGIEGLHMQDLRREFGSRLMESDAPLHVTRDFLGHANISQTSTYLASTLQARKHALHKMETQQATTNAQKAHEAAQKNSHTEPACDNDGPPVLPLVPSMEVVKH